MTAAVAATSGVAAAAAMTAGATWMGLPVHGAIVVGNVCGSFVFLLETTESHLWRKCFYALLSGVLGSGVAPELVARVQWMPEMAAGALASALSCTALIAIFRQAQKTFPALAKGAGERMEHRFDGSATSDEARGGDREQ